jgi:hypothetical protein
MDAEQCRRQAEHYLACANQIPDPSAKAALQGFADYWMRKAEQAERNESGQSQGTATASAQQHGEGKAKWVREMPKEARPPSFSNRRGSRAQAQRRKNRLGKSCQQWNS